MKPFRTVMEGDFIVATKGTKDNKGTQRKLTAILSADVVEYSHLMGKDEEVMMERE